MDKIIKILMENKNIDYEHARSLIIETIDEIIFHPEDTDQIIEEYLGIEPAYFLNNVNS